MGSFTYLMWWIFKKKLNENKDIDRLSVQVSEFVLIGA
jgi:hypothetical protein